MGSTAFPALPAARPASDRFTAVSLSSYGSSYLSARQHFLRVLLSFSVWAQMSVFMARF